MKKTLQVINELEKEGVIQGYAMGGAAALLFYAEPALTFDIDIFVFLPSTKGPSALVDIAPLYKHLEAKGYRAEKEHVMIEGIPVQFLPVYNTLIEEAVKFASKKEYEGTFIKVMELEYLMAIMIDTNRPKDRERIWKLLDEAAFDKGKLDKVLERHSLKKKWRQYFEREER